MKTWLCLLAGLATLAVTSALKVGPVRLPHNNRYINYTIGASPENSLLECAHHLEGEEQLAGVSWLLWEGDEAVGTFEWLADGDATATGRLEGVVELGREDGSLELTELRYDLSGAYSCGVTLASGKKEEAARWEVLVVDSISHQTALHRSLSGCLYSSNYTTLAMFPRAVMRAGLYSEERGGFYKELPESQWLVETHENGSVTYSYSKVTFEINRETPVDISFYVTVGVLKGDGNYIPVSSAMDKHIILHQLGCPEPRVEAYQHVEYHRDTITCRGEHLGTEATVTCKEGYHADGDVEAVLIRCDEATQKWVLENGQIAKRENLECVINSAPSTTTSISATLLCAALVFQRFFLQ